MTAAVQTSMAADRLDAVQVKRDFPLLREAPLARGLHYLDNAATTHKPQAVIDAVSDCYAQAYGPIHRGLYPLAEAATARYEQSRQTLADFIGAESADRLVFAPRLDQAEPLARQRHADLFLDSFVVNAHTTASDALWCGLPVLTCPGETFASRVAGSLLRVSYVTLPEHCR